MSGKRSIAVADCETTPFKIGRVPQPFIWGFYDGREYRQFPHSLDQYLNFWAQANAAYPGPKYATERLVHIAALIRVAFVEFLKVQPIICYAHNGGKFDWHFILPEMTAYDDIFIINGRIARSYIGVAEIRDSYNILPVPLKAYKKDDIDYAVMEESARCLPDNWERITEYLRSDCVYLYELISGFVEKYGVQITQASAAMAQWKKVSKRKAPASTKEYYEQFAPYYYGGRVQCFRAGTIDNLLFNVYDINSAYPFAMLHAHPYSTDYTHIESYVEGADFYRVECVSKGAFPFRGMGSPDRAAGLWFPGDNEMREYTITGWEYVAAKETGALRGVTVKESYLFAEHVDFGEYIQYFYEMRLKAKAEGNDAESLFAKLLMNSLYGKFAANPENYRNYMIVPMDVIAGLESQGWAFAGELGPWALAESPLPEQEQRYYNVATAASITGFVRAMLWRAIASSSAVLYCDTDSIAVAARGQGVVLGERLGQWKHEGVFDKAGIAGKKLYIFRGAPGWWVDKDGRTAFNKVKPEGAEQLIKKASKGARLTDEQLWQLAAGATIQYLAEVPTFSVNKAPMFTNRNIKPTAEDFDHGD